MFMSARTALQRASVGGGAAGPTPHSALTWRSILTNSTANEHVKTYTGAAIGTAAANRWVIIAEVSDAGATPVGVTIGGVTATQIGTDVAPSIWAALVPTGTTATVTIDYGASFITYSSTGYWTVNMSSGVQSFAGGAQGGGPTIVSTVSIPANGFAVIASFNYDSTDDAHSIDASFTEQAENFIAGSTINFACSHRETVAAVSGASVTDTWNTTGGITNATWASWV